MKYFALQAKRFARQIPGLVLVGLCLLAGVAAALWFTSAALAAENNQRLQVAVCGTTQGDFLETGLQLMAGMDSTRYTMELITMEETAAMQALSRGDVVAVVVIPQGFLEDALTGNTPPLEFISTARASGLVPLFKEEMTQAISQYLLASQKGVFGVDTALREGLLSPYAGADLNDLALRYAEKLLSRERLYTTQDLGIAQGLSLSEYLLCGLGILLASLSCLCLGPVLLERDHGTEKMLICRGENPISLAARTWLACFSPLVLVLLPLLAALVLLGGGSSGVLRTLARIVPAVGCVAGLSFLLYALSGDLIGGLLLQFFAMLGLCFLSGCLYPVYFFPTGIQQAAGWLPTALARSQLAACFTGNALPGETLALIGWWVLLTALGILLQARRYRGVAR